MDYPVINEHGDVLDIVTMDELVSYICEIDSAVKVDFDGGEDVIRVEPVDDE